MLLVDRGYFSRQLFVGKRVLRYQPVAGISTLDSTH